ncbi:DUF3862 domain-containing protein [Lactobacillus sp.]|uniref:DUF3862 domain-containing protein n=1 Tax=Lactobacillus sp. TaxID=1591 RepID=UPI0019B5EF07|nr:DUF3862 domain-containing protein [Lactobacillus sp.]MBD5429132.1 DUF3862 domain-containing protein [Lactobacillus sp.]
MFKRIKEIKNLAVATATVIAAIKAVESYGKKVQDKKSKKEVIENSRVLQAKTLREKFDKILVGDLTNEGDGGSSKLDVVELLGEPAVTTDSQIKDVQVEVDTWRRNMIVVTVQLSGEKVVSKNITGFKWGKRPEKLTLEVFNNLETGSSYEEIIELIGEPDGYNESKINSNSLVTATWRTGLTGGRGANTILLFRAGKLVDKSEAHLV